MKSLIVIGPSGVGKGTVISSLLKRHSLFQFVLSFTTRPPRQGQIDGQHYYFINKEEFSARAERGEMLQNKRVFTNWYGTSKQSYFDILKAGKIPLMDVDLQGMKDIRKTLGNEGLGKAEVLCLLPPSWGILRERLSKRGTEKKEVLQQRMEENRTQLAAMMGLQEEGIHFVTNYQYQLTVFGIELFLNQHFDTFRRQYWRNLPSYTQKTRQ